MPRDHSGPGQGSENPGSETIWLALTPPGEGGIGIIQVVGPEAASIVDRIFRGRKGQGLIGAEPGRLFLGHIVEGEELLDEVLVARLPGPETIIEIQCHGGLQPVGRITRSLESQGVRAAPSRQGLERLGRASGLDRIQQEAAEALPGARSILALTLLLSQYHGALTGFVRQLASGAAGPSDVRLLLEPPRLGEILCFPQRVVLAGPPNAGKSSLFNALLQEDRVIIADVPGTTRDAIAESMVFEGIPVTLVDTAGLRPTDHPVESLAIGVSQREIERSDMVLFLFDGAKDLEEQALDQYRKVQRDVSLVLPVLNKLDLAGNAALETVQAHVGREVIGISALRGTGLDDLARRIADAIAPRRHYEAGQPSVFTPRQVSLLERYLAAAGSGAPEGESVKAEICRELLGP